MKEPKIARIQMAFLGIVALLIGIVCMLNVTLVYRLSPITSISESATTGNKAGMLLPFALGCMVTYCIAYTGYCLSERIIVRGMAVGFTIVAMQVCNSRYISESKVGLLGLSPPVSGIVHSIGALIGFGLMFIWIFFFFTKTDQVTPTPRKILRNRIYMVCSGIMLAGIMLIAVNMFTYMGDYLIFIAEEFLLIPAGIAVLIKSGAVLRDK